MRERGPPLPAPLGIPLSWLYAAALGRIRRRFDRGRGVVRFDRPVISVGNLSVGGTGKTPMVRLIAQWLLDAGHRPCIAMRGYRSVRGESDEAETYRRDLPTVPIVAQSNRTLGLIQLFGREHDADGEHSDCIILDDGFQHRQIGRDLDIVLVDATRDPFRDQLLPAGWLREPVQSLRRAGAVVITHAESVTASDIAGLEKSVAAARGGTGVTALCGHSWSALTTSRGGVEQSLPVASLSGQRIVAVCAIGNPGPFIAAAEKASGGPLAASLVLRDHDSYAAGKVQRIIESAQGTSAAFIVTTEKDWSKLRHVPEPRWPCPVVRPRLEMRFDRGENELQSLVLDAAAKVEPDEGDQGQVIAKV